MCPIVVFLVVRLGAYHGPVKSAHTSTHAAWAHYRDKFPNKDKVTEAYVTDSSGHVLERAV